MRIMIDTTDLVSLDDFPLRSRWTDPRYNVLPSADLAAIRPLSLAKAQEVAALTMPDLRSLVESPRGAIPEHFRSPAKEISAEGDVAAVGAWLKELSSGDQSVVVSWDPHRAVLTTWKVFYTYWDDFCYPSSDDVTVVPLSGEWLLWYDHEERFVFGL
jgi:hypothetical protein